MYNAEQKTRFIQEYTHSINTAKVATTIFNAFEKYEEKWGADLCTRTTEELQPAIDELVGLRLRSQWMSFTILKEYVRWCLAMRIPKACDGMLHITAAGLDKVRKQMVSGPVHLQQYLDTVFDPEQEETSDTLYRAYFWMAFCGIREKDACDIKTTDVDFRSMSIRYRDTYVPIYRESLTTFHNVVELTSFVYKHPNYKHPIRRDRVPGDVIMRGVKAVTNTITIRTKLSIRVRTAYESGITKNQLSYYKLLHSGLYYRMYERERAGLPVDFSYAAEEFTRDKEYASEVLKYKTQDNMVREYLEDYQRWKLAFLM